MLVLNDLFFLQRQKQKVAEEGIVLEMSVEDMNLY